MFVVPPNEGLQERTEDGWARKGISGGVRKARLLVVQCVKIPSDCPVQVSFHCPDDALVGYVIGGMDLTGEGEPENLVGIADARSPVGKAFEKVRGREARGNVRLVARLVHVVEYHLDRSVNVDVLSNRQHRRGVMS